MTFAVLANYAASMKEFKRDPVGVIEKAGGEAVLVIERNKPAFYAVPSALYAAMLEACDDNQLSQRHTIHNRQIVTSAESRTSQPTLDSKRP
ncbi:type II toxin-antitoxin system Phd/YefM family antitoxin [Stutzerimonas stutzeri]|uniref:type II toxin-antitoxin system Phd/YefM family antitoxin n=1 Tax=Stutzerimonas stutzeri TaxID=316 RepID=UPI0015E2944E|nr:type II toxin-antitoxin system Phd/YefM family antitoxin [Stutzerimonas stutzeri]